MKKTLLLAILLANLSSFSQAPRGLFVAAGVNQTSIKSSDLLTTPEIGYKLGLIFALGFHESYNYQIEFLYNKSSLGIKAIDSNYENVTKIKYKYETFDFSFLGNYYILKPDEDKLFIGPQAGFIISLAGALAPNDEDGESTQEGSFNDNKLLPYLLESNDFRNMPKIVFSGGFGLTGGYNDLKFDLRYTLGLSNILKTVETNNYSANNLYTGPELNGKLNSISLTLSYRIWKRIKKR
jgi:hypothetical protein